MPLSEPVAREPLHHRDIAICGYQRADGHYDIEARLTDKKTYGFENMDRGWIAPGVPLHEMWTRLTVDDDLLIVAAEASTEHGPFFICPGGAESFSRLAGLTIRPGFLRAALERIGGTEGCTHIREMLQQIATTAMQTMFSLRSRRDAASGDAPAASPEAAARPPRLLNTCYGYASDRDVVRRRYPAFYTGASETETAETSAG